MTIKTWAASALFSIMAITSVNAASITFEQPELRNGTVNAAQDTVTVTQGGVTLEALATEGGRIGVFQTANPVANSDGLYIGIPSGPPFNTDNTTAPTSGTYALFFSEQITSLSFDFDWLTVSTFGEEVLSNFRADLDPIGLTAANFSGSDTTLNVGAQTINTSVNRGSGTVTYSGDAFNFFIFDHTQAARNIGFTITEVRATTLAPVPLPAGFPLLAVGLGAFAVLRRKSRT